MTADAAGHAPAPAPTGAAAPTPAGFVPTGPRLLPGTPPRPRPERADHAEQADHAERPSITATPDGPLLVRGDVDIVTPDGTPVPRDRRTVALCRCGTSTIAPWCDGSHKITGFRTER
ncbi:CDGSH iron-sulfur domain-containing protein [Frigoribacterium salinisoli]